jgi:23S rRNA pseudouridine2605 synthase
VLAADVPDAPKLHKVLAQAGHSARALEMEQMITEGRITVNGEPAHIGQRISVRRPSRSTASRCGAHRAAAAARAGLPQAGRRSGDARRPAAAPHRVPPPAAAAARQVAVGGPARLNTEGLLLFTNSGELANQLMHPRFGVEREYAVRVLGARERGQTAPARRRGWIDGQAQFKSIEDGGGEGANHWYRVVITEGRNREVRKLFEAVGHAVSRLIRIRYGAWCCRAA